MCVVGFVFRQFLHGMDTDEENIVVLVNQFDGFLNLAVHACAHQAAKLSYSMIDVDDVIANGELIQLLERQGDFSATCLIAPEIVLVETIKELMVREETNFQGVVGESFVNGLVDRCEGNGVASVFKYGSDTVGLFFRIAQNIK